MDLGRDLISTEFDIGPRYRTSHVDNRLSFHNLCLSLMLLDACPRNTFLVKWLAVQVKTYLLLFRKRNMREVYYISSVRASGCRKYEGILKTSESMKRPYSKCTTEIGHNGRTR